MVVDKVGVVNGEPLPNEEPPVEPEYQLIVPAEAVAPKETVPEVPQYEPGVVDVIIGVVVTDIFTELEVAGLPETQMAFEVKMQVI